MPADDADLTDDHDTGPDCYATLNVPRNATRDEIRAAFKLLSCLHPDRLGPSFEAQSHAGVFPRVQEAYEVLQDPPRRWVYDHFGAVSLAISLSIAPMHVLRLTVCWLPIAVWHQSHRRCTITRRSSYVRDCSKVVFRAHSQGT